MLVDLNLKRIIYSSAEQQVGFLLNIYQSVVSYFIKLLSWFTLSCHFIRLPPSWIPTVERFLRTNSIDTSRDLHVKLQMFLCVTYEINWILWLIFHLISTISTSVTQHTVTEICQCSSPHIYKNLKTFPFFHKPWQLSDIIMPIRTTVCQLHSPLLSFSGASQNTGQVISTTCIV